MDMNQIRVALSKMNNEQLREVNAMVKAVWDKNARVAARAWMVGEFAQWTNTRTGRPIYIRILKVNTKTIHGMEVDRSGNNVPSPGWRVSPNLLRPFDPNA